TERQNAKRASAHPFRPHPPLEPRVSLEPPEAGGSLEIRPRPRHDGDTTGERRDDGRRHVERRRRRRRGGFRRDAEDVVGPSR
ncbi:hypothetical protein ACHAWF_004761, partial [Thalassiosira exigua]